MKIDERAFIPLYILIGLTFVVAIAGAVIFSSSKDNVESVKTEVAQESFVVKEIQNVVQELPQQKETIEEKKQEKPKAENNILQPVIVEPEVVLESSYKKELAELKRVITILFEDKNLIGIDRYTSLFLELQTISLQVTTQEDQELIVLLQGQLDTLNPPEVFIPEPEKKRDMC